MQVSGTQSHKAQRMTIPSLAARSFVASLHWILCYMIGMHLSSLISNLDEMMDQSHGQVSMGAFWVSQPMALWCRSRLTLWLCPSTLWKIRKGRWPLCAMHWNGTGQCLTQKTFWMLMCIVTLYVMQWCNGFGAMITSDSYTFWTFATWFCWPVEKSTLVCQGASFLANETLVTQLHLEFVANFFIFVFWFFCHMLSLLRKGKHFRMWAIQASLCLLEPYGQLCFTCSPGQGRWFVRWRNLSINSLDQRSQHWLLEITDFFHWMIMIMIYMIYDSLVIV